jgi:hypothetical protein
LGDVILTFPAGVPFTASSHRRTQQQPKKSGQQALHILQPASPTGQLPLISTAAPAITDDNSDQINQWRWLVEQHAATVFHCSGSCKGLPCNFWSFGGYFVNFNLFNVIFF